MASCILYQNSDRSIFVLDIPSSIEDAQGANESRRRLISCKALEEPYPSLEPKSKRAIANVAAASLEDLLVSKHLQFALDRVKTEFEGDWCRPRAVLTEPESRNEYQPKKRKRLEPATALGEEDNALFVVSNGEGGAERLLLDSLLYRSCENMAKSFIANGHGKLPPTSTFLNGDITLTRDCFVTAATNFDLIVMDPPWPNRSARRKNAYELSYGNADIEELISSIPVKSHLADQGNVAVWITNKAAFRDMLLKPGGIFDNWGIELVEECIWLKTTKNGEPICALDSRWRKPYEILLIGRRGQLNVESVKRRVIIGVPDLHSRKPNLKPLFDQILGPEYKGLEIFARNLTAGWWAWGNEVLKFQMDACWMADVDK